MPQQFQNRQVLFMAMFCGPFLDTVQQFQLRSRWKAHESEKSEKKESRMLL